MVICRLLFQNYNLKYLNWCYRLFIWVSCASSNEPFQWFTYELSIYIYIYICIYMGRSNKKTMNQWKTSFEDANVIHMNNLQHQFTYASSNRNFPHFFNDSHMNLPLTILSYLLIVYIYYSLLIWTSHYGSGEALKIWKTEEHPSNYPPVRYAHVHTSNWSCFLVFMHIGMLKITCMHLCTPQMKGY